MSARNVAIGACCLILGAGSLPAQAQQPDSSKPAAPHGVRFSGTIASMETTRPVQQADVRLMRIDSVHAEKNADGTATSEIFVDSLRSRVGITDTAGAFNMLNVPSGSYLINVRRLGFAPFEGVVKLDTARVEMELAMTQVIPILTKVKITETAVSRVERHLKRVGFTDRRHVQAGGTFIDRSEIARRHATYVTDVLDAYGVHIQNAIVYMDRMQIDSTTLRNYPAELVVGIEFYRHRSELPIEFNATLPSDFLALGSRGQGGISPVTVLIWTYIP